MEGGENKTMKKLIAGLGAAVLALTVAGTAGAAKISLINDDSAGTSVSVKSILAKITNNNGLGVLNAVSSSGNSGGNTVVSADDQSSTTVGTGVASAATLVDSTANANEVVEDYESAAADDEITNVDDNSDGTATTADSLENDIVNNNATQVTNSVGGTSDSGTNAVVSGDSLTDTAVTSGSSDAAAGVLQAFNLNVKDIMHRVKWKP